MARANTHRHTDTEACRLLDFEDAAQYLGMTYKALRAWYDERHLNGFPVVNLGPRTTRVRLCALNEWIETRDKGVKRGQL